MLKLLQGPAGGGKSQLAAGLLARGEVDALADVTAIWAALSGAVRDPTTGKYPVRPATDPLLPLSTRIRGDVVREALRRGLNVAVTSSNGDPEVVARWRRLSAELNALFEVDRIDPGLETVVGRLVDPETGELDPECEEAVHRYYDADPEFGAGDDRPAPLTPARRRAVTEAIRAELARLNR